ncbi:MAG: two-component system nitrate/nitrite sensor histidine kinase NarX [Chitinophagales bacterium]|jgi:two-component system nitrate/nitrite sensor histidine kinase NarX
MSDSNKTTSRPKSNFIGGWFIKLDSKESKFFSTGRFRILSLLVAQLLLVVATAATLITDGQGDSLYFLLPWVSLLFILLTLLLGYSIWSVLLDPLLQISHWAESMRGVNLDDRVDIAQHNDFRELGNDINMLARMITQLSRNTEIQLEKHTDYISRESRSLSIQYDVASSISISRDLNELFQKSLESLSHNLNTSAAVVRQRMDSNELEVVSYIGALGKHFLANLNNRFPLSDLEDRKNPTHPNLSVVALVDRHLNSQLTQERIVNYCVVSIPMTYRDQLSGVINLFFPEDFEPNLEQYNDLLHSVGQHLGAAIEKYRLGEEESQLLIIQERTRMSHELHDSLAQTIASLRIQIRVLDEISHAGDEKSMRHQMERIEFTIFEANKQLRELIAHFQIPMNKRGLVTSVEETVQRHRDESSTQFYFQNEWPSQELPANIELHVLRIIQESLANIRKHSQARSVRIILRGNSVLKQYQVLIEDDGIGFEENSNELEKGEHFGLNILEDRARQINGTISIESELGEGTQVNLEFTFKPTNNGTHLKSPEKPSA